MGAAAARVLAERGWARLADRAARDRARPRRLGPRHALVPPLAHRTPTTCGSRCARSSSGTTSSAAAARRCCGATACSSAAPSCRRWPPRCARRACGYDELDHRDVSRLFPEMRPQPDAPAIFQPDGAVILARRSIEVQVRLAVRGGRGRAREREVRRARAAGRRRARLHAPPAHRCRRRRRVRRAVVAAAARPARPAAAAAGRSRPGHLVPQPATPAGRQRPGLMERTHGRRRLRHARAGKGFKLGWATINPMTFWKASKVRPYDRENEQALVERVREDFPGFDPTPLHHEAGPITLVPDELFVIDRARADRRRRRLHRPRLQVLAGARRAVRRSRRGAAAAARGAALRARPPDARSRAPQRPRRRRRLNGSRRRRAAFRARDTVGLTAKEGVWLRTMASVSARGI